MINRFHCFQLRLEKNILDGENSTKQEPIFSVVINHILWSQRFTQASRAPTTSNKTEIRCKSRSGF